jgi:hypothetical protein
MKRGPALASMGNTPLWLGFINTLSVKDGGDCMTEQYILMRYLGEPLDYTITYYPKDIQASTLPSDVMEIIRSRRQMLRVQFSSNQDDEALALYY